MDVDTTSCSFTVTPKYFISVGGVSAHWSLASYTAIESPTSISFRVYGRPLMGISNELMYNYSQTRQWNLNWFGVII